MSTVSHPTFIFGLGELGREVLTRLDSQLTHDGGPQAANAVLAHLDLTGPDEEEEAEEIVARVEVPGARRETPKDESEEKGVKRVALSAPMEEDDLHRLRDFTLENSHRLLRLTHFLDYTQAGDLFRPNFSVFVIGDLKEEEVRLALSGIVEVVGQSLLSRYSHIFTPLDMGGPNFGVYPILVLGGVHEPDPELRKAVTEAVKGMAALSETSVRWWNTPTEDGRSESPCIGRITLLDDQTEKYVLDRSEIISSILSFLTMGLFCGDLRQAREQDPVWPLATFLQKTEKTESAIPYAEDRGLFATFGAATLDVAQQTARTYIHNRLSLSILSAMRPEAPAEPLGERLRHMRSPKELDPELQKTQQAEEGHEQTSTFADEIRDRLKRLSKELTDRCPEVYVQDSPETIVNDKYSWPWYEDLAHLFTHTGQEIEERLLPRASEEIDRRGLFLARRHFAELGDQVDKWVWAQPVGWHRARQHLTELNEAVEREEKSFELEPNLPDLPDTEPVRKAVLEVRHCARLWPRQWRMLLTSVFAVILLTLVFHFLPKWIYVRFVYENHIFIKEAKARSILGRAKQIGKKAVDKAKEWAGLSDPDKGPKPPPGYVRDPRYDPPGWFGNPMLFKLPPSYLLARLTVDRPYVFVWLFLLFGALVSWVLRRHMRKQKEEMDRAIWLLKNRIEELVLGQNRSALMYFEKRLEFSRDLWIRRLLDRLQDQAREEIERLNVVDKALNQLVHYYREGQKRLGVRFVGPDEDIEDLSEIKSEQTDPIYRRLLSGEALTELNEEVVPNPEKHAVEFFEQQRDKNPPGTGKERLPEWRDSAPFADGQVLDSYVKQVIEDSAREINVLEQALGGDRELDRRGEFVTALRQFFLELSGKLSHSVELSMPSEAVEVTRLLVAPEKHLAALKETFKELADETSLQEAQLARLLFVGSEDQERLHLFVGYAGLSLDTFRWLSTPGPTKESLPSLAHRKQSASLEEPRPKRGEKRPKASPEQEKSPDPPKTPPHGGLKA